MTSYLIFINELFLIIYYTLINYYYVIYLIIMNQVSKMIINYYEL